MSGFEYSGKERTSAQFSIPVTTRFTAIVKVFQSVRFLDDSIPDEQVAFVILELVSNSIRAHRERGIEDDVMVTITVEDAIVRLEVLDWGGGFSPDLLPYSMKDPVEKIDLMSEEFSRYRLAHDNMRFGMGLLAAKRLFALFSLDFVGRDSRTYDWPSPKIEGTRIRLERNFSDATH